MTWRARADRFWAAELGVDAALLAFPGVHVRERGDTSGTAPVIVVGTARTAVISVPRSGAAEFTAAGLDLAALGHDPRTYLDTVPANTLEVRGPASLAYWPTPAGSPASPGGIRELGPDDQAALDGLGDLAPEEWSEAGFGAGSRIFGCMAGRDLLAVAGYETWPPDLAHLQVFSRPDRRRRGLGAQVLSAAIGRALGAGLLPQYRVHHRNVASRALATRLGFAEYGWMATVYLRGARA